MRRILLIVMFLTCAVISSAQKHPLGGALEGTLELLNNGHTAEAYAYWNDNSKAYSTDSLYIWASALAAQNFMGLGCFAETETLLNNSEQTLNQLKSNSYWWHQQWGYLSTRKAILYGSMHDYTLARASAVDAKIAFEQIAYRGLDYALALAVL